jgi:3-deoxy-D-manno-octulosonic-acid transferase
VPVFFGPHVANFKEETGLLIDAGAGFKVKDADDLAKRIRGLLADPRAAADAGRRGREAVLANRGALARTASLVMRVMMEG